MERIRWRGNLTTRPRSNTTWGPRMVDPLEPLLVDGVIDEVLSRLKSGKEADLYLVRHGQEVVAAKVYKARETRSFKNNSAYLEGRRTRNSRTQRAMDRGSRFGKAAAEEAWKTKEADALHALHAAGVKVPRPVLFYEGVLLMEVVVDATGRPAPRLIDAEIPREQAATLYAELRSQVVRMLCCDLVHGDLSAYNVLLGWDGPVIIDFPQVVGAAHNSQAEGFFFRDLANLRHFFEAIDPAIKSAAGDGREIWRAYTKRELSPDFVPAPPRPGAAPVVDPRELPPEQKPAHPQRSGAAGRPPHQQRQPQAPRQSQQQPQRPALPGRQPQQQRAAQPSRPQPPERQPQRPPQPPRQPQAAHQAQQQPQRPAQPGRQPQQQRAAQPQRPQAPERQPQRPTLPGRQPQQQRRQGGGSQPPRGPIVERRPVLGAAVAPVSAQTPVADGVAPSSPGQGRKRRRRGRRGGGGAGGGGSGPSPG